MLGHIGLIVLMPFMLIFAVLLLLGIKLSQAARRRWAESTYSRVTMGMADTNEQQALLIYAASHGLTHMVRDLVRRNIDVNCQDDSGKTALDVAANYEIDDVNEFLDERLKGIHITESSLKMMSDDLGKNLIGQ